MKGLITNTKDDLAYIDADDWAYMQASFIGVNGITKFKGQLKASKVNDNLTRMADGVFFINGRAIINKNTFDFKHDSGSLGLNRYDLIIAEFRRNGAGDGKDTLQFKVVKGTSTSGTATKPLLSNNDTVHQIEVCEVYFSGANMVSVRNTANYISGLDEDSGWIDVGTLNNKWEWYGGVNKIQYRRIGQRVYLRGIIKNGGVGPNVSVFTLPADFRPKSTNILSTISQPGAMPSRVDVKAGGQVTVESGGNQLLSLDGLSFFLD